MINILCREELINDKIYSGITFNSTEKYLYTIDYRIYDKYILKEKIEYILKNYISILYSSFDYIPTIKPISFKDSLVYEDSIGKTKTRYHYELNNPRRVIIEYSTFFDIFTENKGSRKQMNIKYSEISKIPKLFLEERYRKMIPYLILCQRNGFALFNKK